MSGLRVEQRGAVRVMTIDRPEVENCVDAPTAVSISETIDAFAADDEARVLVVTGAGGRAFCSGANLKDVEPLGSHEHAERASPLGFGKLDPGKPTIAAVEGYCFAGGLELAAWCDFRIAGDTAEFGALNRRWGVPFIDGGTQRFARIVGQGTALWMIETGVRFGAEKAEAIGLVQEVVDAGRALERALELAERIADYPQASLRADRASLLEGLGLPLADGLLLEYRRGRSTLDDPEMQRGLERFARGERPEAPRLPG